MEGGNLNVAIMVVAGTVSSNTPVLMLLLNYIVGMSRIAVDSYREAAELKSHSCAY